MTVQIDPTNHIDPRSIQVSRPPASPEPHNDQLTNDRPQETPSPADIDIAIPEPKPRKTNALLQHSLRDDAEKLAARAVKPTPIFGPFVLLGQLFMIYAAPGSGKTILMIWLIIDAIRSGRVDPENVIYINADDNGNGVSEKVSLLAEHGAHMVVPGYRGFKSSQFVDKLKQMIADGSANGIIVIIDTLKKFTNPMDKTKSSEFAQVCREFVLAGGTMIALGHTTKNANPDGTPKYQGTTDIVEDFDAVYVGQHMNGEPGSNERIIELTRLKSRGDSPDKLGYAFSAEDGLTYEQKLNTLREVYPEELDGRALEARIVADDEIIESLRGYLACGHGHVGMDYMVRVLAKVDGYSRVQLRRVLDRYTGSDPAQHRWDYTKGAGGKRTYFLLARPDD